MVALKDPWVSVVDIRINWSPLEGVPDLDSLHCRERLHRARPMVLFSTADDGHRHKSRRAPSRHTQSDQHRARGHVAAPGRPAAHRSDRDAHAFRAADAIVTWPTECSAQRHSPSSRPKASCGPDGRCTRAIELLSTNLRRGYAPRSPDRLPRGHRDRTGASACRGDSHRWPVRRHQHRLLAVVRRSRRRRPRGRHVGGPRRVRRDRRQRRAAESTLSCCCPPYSSSSAPSAGSWRR